MAEFYDNARGGLLDFSGDIYDAPSCRIGSLAAGIRSVAHASVSRNSSVESRLA